MVQTEDQGSVTAPSKTAGLAAIPKAAPKDIAAILAELGGDTPQNRAIAEGLQNQGVKSVSDIGVRKVPVPGHFEGTDEAAQWVPETTSNTYFNKSTGNEINPTRLGIIQNGQAGVEGGDVFFHLNADDQGNVKFDPQWSPRAHGFLRDNAVGQLIMKAGAIIPNPFQPYFVAANVGDALAHEQYLKAALAAVPYAAQEFGVTDAIKGALGMGPSGLDMGEVIPQGGIAQFAPEEVANLTANRLIDASADNPMGFPYTGAVDYIPLDAIKQTANFVNPLSSEITIDDIIKAKDVEAVPVSIDDIVGSDWSAGTPTTGMEGNLPADLANYYSGMNEFPITSNIPSQLTDNSLTQPLTTANASGTTKLYPNSSADDPFTVEDPTKDLMGRPIAEFAKPPFPNSSADNVYTVSDPTKDLMGNPISNDLTLDKIKDLGTAYLSNPAALAGLVGTGLAATGLVNNVINPAKTPVADTTTQAAAPTANMVPAGPTPGLQDLFDYANLYKSSPFAQRQTQQPTQQQPPGFTVSDVFRSLMADAGPQPKIEPNLVGLADLQKQMARK